MNNHHTPYLSHFTINRTSNNDQTQFSEFQIFESVIDFDDINVHRNSQPVIHLFSNFNVTQMTNDEKSDHSAHSNVTSSDVDNQRNDLQYDDRKLSDYYTQLRFSSHKFKSSLSAPSSENRFHSPPYSSYIIWVNENDNLYKIHKKRSNVRKNRNHSLSSSSSSFSTSLSSLQKMKLSFLLN